MSESSPIAIAAAGAVTAVGLSLAETAASARARLVRLREIEWRDRRFEPFIVGSVPEDGLPPLAEALQARALSYREARMLRLAQLAIEDTLGTPEERAALGVDAEHPLPLLLGLPEHHTTQPIDAARFLQRLALQANLPLELRQSTAAPRGRAAALMALRTASARLQRGDCPYVLVGGVDSLVDLYVLGTLDREGRVRNEANSDGLSPGEGAGFVLLCTAQTAQQRGLQPLAWLQGAAAGQEAGHLYAEDEYLGEGLAGAFAALLAEAPPKAPIGCVYASFNGERYWAREYGVARLRNAAAFDPEHAVEHPAECFGDLGAAHGAVLLALAAQGVAAGYRRSPCLVFASSDHADRAAALITQQAA
ncbi:3-oxoacyl-(acyl-carrier-protein) synthase-1 [Rubrivivax sp. A210]|uniref:beta-ketoacyl synthase N-terminal-like domain-containing protein n=1 Tax=Rubrivivax sp. A210 TaxID=2772301 RepID=UPI00191B88A4|nr:beta-ketoacyl synthase N-terminal-like domain-containing protein [Rubrivivax sp. A210]CAD5373640.1 3-oxoacyl-(acyl-carrier-protein) synthase-1 [Rubrivivax sp. A210]